MSSSMIQNSIAQREAAPHKSVMRKANHDVDYRHLQVGAKPLVPKGHLISHSKSSLHNTVDQFRYLASGLKGDANDHKLGKINDLAMKVGALGIGGYLATRRMLPAKKGMEFVGAGTFFASMVLFPKVCIQYPIQLFHGFNVNQKWEDSIHRKNDLLRDRQYQPWDIVPQAKIDKIGDHMHVPRDMNERREFIKDKVSKTAIQANTLWMLTAGLATPVMGALMASGIEKHVMQPAVLGLKTRRVNDRLNNIGDVAANGTRTSNNNIKKMHEFLEESFDKPADDKFIDKVSDMLSKGDEDLKESIAKDIKVMIAPKKNPKVNVSKVFDGIDKNEDFKSFGLTEKTITKHLEDNGISGEVVFDDKMHRKFKKTMQGLFKAKVKEARNAGKEFTAANIEEKLNNPLSAILEEVKTPRQPVVSPPVQKMLNDVAKSVEGYKAQMGVVNDFVEHQLFNEDSKLSHKWNKAVEGTMNALGYSDEELKQARTSPVAAAEILDKKLVELAKNPGENDATYKKTVGKIARLIEGFEKDVNQHFVDSTVEDHIKPIMNQSASEFRSKGLDNTANYLVGHQAKGIKASVLSNKQTAMTDKVAGARASLYKIIHGLDLYKNIESGKVEEALTKQRGRNKDNGHVKEVIKGMKRVILDAGIGEHTVKFDVPFKTLYQDFMQLGFYQRDGEMSPTNAGKRSLSMDDSTREVLDGIDGSFSARFYKQMEETCDKVGNAYYKFAHEHKTGGGITPEAPMIERQMNIGETLSNLTKKAAEGMYNTKRWTKMFGGFALGLAVVTAGSTALFGRIKIEQDSKGGQG